MDIEARVNDVEKRVSKIETTLAVESERYDQIVSRLSNIDGHLSWIFKLLVGGILGALLTFILRGGLVL